MSLKVSRPFVRFINKKWGNKPLRESDPVVFDIIEREKNRQWKGLELIASENFVSQAVLEAIGSIMTNKYAEGYPGHRYYGGNQIIDESETLCQERALELFGLDPTAWGVNVQPLSGSPANFAAYNAVMGPHGRLMGLDLKSGGHLTHGYRSAKKSISATSKFFESLPYHLDPATGYIDYDGLERDAANFHPQVIVCGASAYPRDFDYPRLRKIADSNGAYLMCDMAHIAGLVAAGLMKSPFEYCDIVTTTTHKTLRGPRAGLIFYRKGVRRVTKKGKEIKYNLEKKINDSIFPSLQGGPHENAIAGIAVALKEANSEEFREYQRQVKKNAKVLGEEMLKRGYDLVSGGTDNHLILLDLHPKNIDGARVEKVLEMCDITVNKNTVPKDTSAFIPGGLRLGSPALTSRGLVEEDFRVVADFVDRGIELTREIASKVKGKKLKDFEAALKDWGKDEKKLKELKEEVMAFAKKFNFPGFSIEDMVYKD